MPNYEQVSTKKSNPLTPLIGFIILIVVGGLSYLTSPMVVNWLGTTTFKLGSLGQILPIEFPAEWPDPVVRIVVALFMFLVVFTVAMMLLFVLMRPPREELDVELKDIRAAREKERKRR